MDEIVVEVKRKSDGWRLEMFGGPFDPWHIERGLPSPQAALMRAALLLVGDALELGSVDADGECAGRDCIGLERVARVKNPERL